MSLQFVGDSTAFFNAELRSPYRSHADADRRARRDPRRVLCQHGRRKVRQDAAPPRNSGGGWKWWSSGTDVYTPINGFVSTGLGQQAPVYGTPVVVDGFRLVDARAASSASGWKRLRLASDSLRLGVEDAVQPGLGRRALQAVWRERRVPEGEVLGLDRVRLLILYRPGLVS